MIEISPYDPSQADAWNALVAVAPTATLLHDRRYMDYHADRFTDCSLMARDSHRRLVAVLPACAQADTVVSHAGLTYGGWLTDPRHVATALMLEIFDAMRSAYRSMGFSRLRYKPVPTIYHTYPAQDDIYALFRNGAAVESVGISAAVDLSRPLAFDSNATRGARAAAKAGVIAGPSRDLAAFWKILTEVLSSRYGKRPVHTLAEMELLVSRFPGLINLHAATADGEMVAGTLVYVAGPVAHAQYIAASPRGKELKALPMVMADVARCYADRCRYLDFGISTEQGGRYLNEGLARQKNGMGGRGVAYESYLMDL